MGLRLMKIAAAVIFEWHNKEGNGDISHLTVSVTNSVGHKTAVQAETVFLISRSTYSRDVGTPVVTQDDLDIPILKN